MAENETIEADIDQPFSFPGNRNEGTVSLTVFRNINKNVPIFSGWGASTVYYEEHETDGIEVSVDYRVGSLGTVYSSFAYMDPVITSTTHPDGVGLESTSVPIPRYSASLGFDAQLTNMLMVTAIGTYNDGQRNRQINTQTGKVTTTYHSSYTRINLSGKYRWSDLVTTIVRVENLLDQKDLGYKSETHSPTGVEVTQTTATDPGRFVSLAVTLNF